MLCGPVWIRDFFELPSCCSPVRSLTFVAFFKTTSGGITLSFVMLSGRKLNFWVGTSIAAGSLSFRAATFCCADWRTPVDTGHLRSVFRICKLNGSAFNSTLFAFANRCFQFFRKTLERTPPTVFLTHSKGVSSFPIVATFHS